MTKTLYNFMYMKNKNISLAQIKSILIGLLIVLIMGPISVLGPSAKADINPKVKSITTLALYGTACGALLGTASIAFGTGTRAIFQGASLGLYAGLLFGGYVLFTHQQKKKVQGEESYPGNVRGIYQSEDDETYSPDIENRWSLPSNAMDEFWDNKWRGRSREKGQSFLFYMNLLQFQF